MGRRRGRNVKYTDRGCAPLQRDSEFSRPAAMPADARQGRTHQRAELKKRSALLNHSRRGRLERRPARAVAGPTVAKWPRDSSLSTSSSLLNSEGDRRSRFTRCCGDR